MRLLTNLVVFLTFCVYPAVAWAEGTAPVGNAPTGESPWGGLINMLLIIGPMFLLFWLFFIRPESKRQKEHQRMLSELKKGDEVLTIGGIFGRIVEVRGDRMVVEIADNTRVKLTNDAVARVIQPDADEKKS
ncbi:MAG: preprotein translocase subunit YajC [Candidatus Brocadiia bacterium]